MQSGVQIQHVCIHSNTTERIHRLCQFCMPVSDEQCEILTVNIFQIFTLCKDSLLSCNATQGVVNILTWLLNLANSLSNVSSSAWLGACAGVAALLAGLIKKGLTHKQVFFPQQELSKVQVEEVVRHFVNYSFSCQDLDKKINILTRFFMSVDNLVTASNRLA